MAEPITNGAARALMVFPAPWTRTADPDGGARVTDALGQRIWSSRHRDAWDMAGFIAALPLLYGACEETMRWIDLHSPRGEMPDTAVRRMVTLSNALGAARGVSSPSSPDTTHG